MDALIAEALFMLGTLFIVCAIIYASHINKRGK